MNEQQAIEHDAGEFSRADIKEAMLGAAPIMVELYGDSAARAIAVATADVFDLWQGNGLPQWVMDAAKWAAEEADRIRKGESYV